MGFVLLQWGKEEIIPKYWGYIDQSKIKSNKDSIINRSLAMSCDKCGNIDNWRILKGGEKDNLFFIVPLGSTKVFYKLYCNKCNAFQMIIGRFEMDKLVNEGIAIEKAKME